MSLDRPQYQSLIASKWDVVTIMLGTNDAKDKSSGGPPDWQHDCGGADHTTLAGCTFASDFKAMIDEIRTLGTTAAGPKIFTLIPPPLMGNGYGMNATVINSVLPRLVPLIHNASLDIVHTAAPIDIFSAMGGVQDWQQEFPPQTTGCTINSSWAPCRWWCDKQSCDNCHPNDNGYHHLASLLLDGISVSLPPAPPRPPPSPRAPGAWIYEFNGDGRLFVPAANLTANTNSDRRGARAWDACSSPSLAFDNGHKLRDGATQTIGGVSASDGLRLRGAGECGKTFSYPDMAVGEPFGESDGIRYEQWLYLEIAK